MKTVQVDGKVFDLLANVRKNKENQFVYSIQMRENKKIEASPPIEDNKSSLKRVLNASDNNSMAENPPAVKPSEEKISSDNNQYMQNSEKDTRQMSIKDASAAGADNKNTRETQ